MKLKSVSVYGLFNSYNHSIELSDEGLTFIHSPNGTGKSTLLNIIYDIFNSNYEELSSIVFDRIDMDFDDDISVILENYDEVPSIQIRKNELEEKVSIDDVKEMFNIVYLSSERNIVKKMDGRLIPALDAYAAEFNDRLVFSKNPIDLENYKNRNRTEMDDGEFIFWCNDLKARFEFISEAGLNLKIPSEYKFPPTRLDFIEDREGYTKLAYSIDDWINRNYWLAESIILYIDIVNRLFSNKKVFLSDRDQLTVKLNSGITIPLNKLSAGEKQIMIIFYRLLFHAKAGTFVIIDEPETSLHTSWQQEICSLFLDICRARNIQMLVATHSPQIFHNRPDLVRELRSKI
ncbi:MAG: AAA family ATPase [archaeon]|nr:AAA family ATPase [archaeon]